MTDRRPSIPGLKNLILCKRIFSWEFQPLRLSAEAVARVLRSLTDSWTELQEVPAGKPSTDATSGNFSYHNNPPEVGPVDE